MSSFIPKPNLDLIDLLLGEHGCLFSLFRHIERRLPSMSLEEVMVCGGVVEALLMAHAVDEDELLFNAMPAEQKSVAATLDAMYGEHNEQRRMLEDLKSMTEAGAARRQLARLMELTREHFAVEERTLFGLAKMVLTEQRLMDLGQEYARRRGLSTLF